LFWVGGSARRYNLRLRRYEQLTIPEYVAMSQRTFSMLLTFVGLGSFLSRGHRAAVTGNAGWKPAHPSGVMNMPRNLGAAHETMASV
jgi:hypothetical protein